MHDLPAASVLPVHQACVPDEQSYRNRSLAKSAYSALLFSLLVQFVSSGFVFPAHSAHNKFYPKKTESVQVSFTQDMAQDIVTINIDQPVYELTVQIDYSGYSNRFY